jgi:hypothetical protein
MWRQKSRTKWPQCIQCENKDLGEISLNLFWTIITIYLLVETFDTMDIKLCEEKNSRQKSWPKFKLMSSFEILLLNK